MFFSELPFYVKIYLRTSIIFLPVLILTMNEVFHLADGFAWFYSGVMWLEDLLRVIWASIKFAFLQMQLVVLYGCMPSIRLSIYSVFSGNPSKFSEKEAIQYYAPEYVEFLQHDERLKILILMAVTTGVISLVGIILSYIVGEWKARRRRYKKTNIH